ncbi:hypothetical protein LZ554_001009 [Drepanopeziza brunnea f. sp. 'monogermtubi']|nr:hypothetical protein LZ554_001009 [Drepanopeziza brunnea f. sp. 'monogermtubi']
MDLSLNLEHTHLLITRGSGAVHRPIKSHSYLLLSAGAKVTNVYPEFYIHKNHNSSPAVFSEEILDDEGTFLIARTWLVQLREHAKVDVERKPRNVGLVIVGRSDPGLELHWRSRLPQQVSPRVYCFS